MAAANDLDQGVTIRFRKFDAIDAACFKEKIKVIFLYLKSGLITIDELKKRSEKKELAPLSMYSIMPRPKSDPM